jgi:hypothetical protein
MVDIDDIESYEGKISLHGESTSDCTESELDWGKVNIMYPCRKGSASAFLYPSYDKTRSWYTNYRRSTKDSKQFVQAYERELSLSSDDERVTRRQKLQIYVKSDAPKTSSSNSYWNERTRTKSGTPVIHGLYSALPDSFTFDSQSSPTPPGKPLNASPITNSLKLDSDWSEGDDESLSCKLTLCLDVPSRKHGPSQSRRGSQLAPPREIWVTGGPRPGLYKISGKIHGRPMWEGEKVELR